MRDNNKKIIQSTPMNIIFFYISLSRYSTNFCISSLDGALSPSRQSTCYHFPINKLNTTIHFAEQLCRLTIVFDSIFSNLISADSIKLKRYKIHELFFCPLWIIFCIYQKLLCLFIYCPFRL